MNNTGLNCSLLIVKHSNFELRPGSGTAVPLFGHLIYLLSSFDLSYLGMRWSGPSCLTPLGGTCWRGEAALKTGAGRAILIICSVHRASSLSLSGSTPLKLVAKNYWMMKR